MRQPSTVPDASTYHCINPDCARAMPRRVGFCPYCGTAQAGAAPRAAMPEPVLRAEPAAAPASAPAPAPMPAAPAPMAAPRPAAAPAPSATDFGRSGAVPGPAPAQVPEAAPAPRSRWGRGPAAPAPSGRKPVRLRWWLLILAALWGLWVWAKPSARKIERRIDHAIELARACKAREAQDELIALRPAHATERQLARVQDALNEEAAACTRRRQREKAWRDTSDAVEAALASSSSTSADRARARLQAYTRRWGEDERSRALMTRIEAERHPLAAPGAE
jgi:hypothetical protein